MVDRFRRPEKILEASERLVPIVVEWCTRQASRPGAPLIIFVLHKGADSFMSDADFRTFYWPTLKAVMKGLIDRGHRALHVRRGRLQQEAGSDRRPRPAHRQRRVAVRPDRHVRGQAGAGRPLLHRRQRPHGPSGAGTPGEVEKYVTDLLDGCARDGGVLLQNGAVLDDAKAENLKAMLETGQNWRG